jgi:minor extracellular serine protease Vpr
LFRRIRWTQAAFLALSAALPFAPARADNLVNKDTKADLAAAKYHVTGKGVIVAVLDRGLDYAHPDFRNVDGTTRIKAMLDMTGQNLCNAQGIGSPSPIEYTEEQINTALRGGKAVPERDAVGHGTVTTGLAAGNGSALSDTAQYAGAAPQADLIIVKLTSEGAPAHGDQPAEAPFQGCIQQALAWLDGKITELGEPAIALIDSGTQWGPIDGTSAVSRNIDAVFGANRPGRIFVLPSGDEGGLPNHAGGAYNGATATVVPISRSGAETTDMSLWYTGSEPAEVTLSFDDGTSVGPIGPGDWVENQKGISIIQYDPGQEFYPWTSTDGDRAVWFRITGHKASGQLSIQGTGSGTGRYDLYGDVVGPNQTAIDSFPHDLVPGRLSDYASTRSAIVAGASVVRTSWIDVNGYPESLTNQGPVGGLWVHSSGGPTRDGRLIGVDVVTPGENSFAAYAPDSYWATFKFNEIQGGGGWYGRHGATSAASPIAVGAVALMLQLDPKLTEEQAKIILHETSTADAFTGRTPNANWGYGKLNVLAALDAVARIAGPTAIPSASTLVFPKTNVGAKSTAKILTLANTGVAALEIHSIAVSGSFTQSNSCGMKLAAGKRCDISVVFQPATSGTHSGELTLRDNAPDSPQSINLSGTGVEPEVIGVKLR